MYFIKFEKQTSSSWFEQTETISVYFNFLQSQYGGF